jgi:sporulation protein YlmC with PRC-barrel domain
MSVIAVSGQAQDKSPQTQDKPPVAGIVPLGVALVETQAVATGWRASKLMHADVYNDNNQKIGKIDDFIVSPDGKLSVAVVDVGGFLGLAAHRVAIPVEQFGKVAPKVVLKGATKEVLKELPEFKYAA